MTKWSSSASLCGRSRSFRGFSRALATRAGLVSWSDPTQWAVAASVVSFSGSQSFSARDGATSDPLARVRYPAAETALARGDEPCQKFATLSRKATLAPEFFESGKGGYRESELKVPLDRPGRADDGC